ncbi:hypothetical protein TWF696_007431 [Orbilia brochopaga]|uniref:Uncharacterized protein n=1 Tax=Orbilia brochopaga TaxID=3140254 RepID=A0AAV9US03_9PEZI
MSSLSNPGGRAVLLTLPCNPPSAASSVYAASEASTDTTTTASAASFASYNSTSTIGSSAFVPAYAQPDREPIFHDAAYISGTPLPLLQLQDGDTLVYLNPSKFAASACPPLRVLSSNLNSTNSPVFQQLLSPSAQKRILNRLLKQKKPQLTGGKLPTGIRFVLDLTPEDEGDKAVEWQEKLWCPDVVLQWNSSLVEPEPLPVEEEAEQQLEAFRQKAGWGKGKSSGGSHTAAVEPYSFGRHVLNLERLIHILHGIDPLIQTTVDWYTLHCLSVAFGTTDATRDYIARWIFCNSLIIESHPSFIWQVAIEAGLATIASDAFAAAVMKYSMDPQEATCIPGALEAAVAFFTRVQKEFQDLLDLNWIDQYLPPTPPKGSLERHKLDSFRDSYRKYVSRQLEVNVGGIESSSNESTPKQAMLRSTWLGLQNTTLSNETSYISSSNLDSISFHDLACAVEFWQLWENSSSVGSAAGNDDLWADVMRHGVPRHAVASVTQHTAFNQGGANFEDAKSEMTSINDAEIISFPAEEDEMKIDNQDDPHDSDPGEGPSTMTSIKSSVNPSGSSPKPDPDLDDDRPGDAWLKDYCDERKAWLQENSDELGQPGTIGQDDIDTQATNAYDIESSPRSTFPKSDPTAPRWLIEQLAKLCDENRRSCFWALMHHPQNDTSRPPEPRIRCLDCPDMLYFPGPGETLDNFRVHLRNIRHITRLHSRQLSEGLTSMSATNKKSVETSAASRSVDIPHGLLPIIRSCETYIKSKCAEMTARNIVFDPILLEEQLACLEESERAFMPLWAGGEVAPNASFSKTTIPNRGVSDSAVDDGMTINISSVGVGSVCTASTFATDESFTELNTPEDSLGSGSVISLDDNNAESTSQSIITPSADDDEDDWVMEGDDDDEFVDDDTYFS